MGDTSAIFQVFGNILFANELFMNEVIHGEITGKQSLMTRTGILSIPVTCEQALFELSLKFEREPAGLANKNASVRCLERRRVLPLVEIE